jgi:TatD DNase family protein
MKTIDTHAHIDELEEIDRVIEESKKNGLIGIIGVGMDLRSNEVILSISKRYPDYVFSALGLHPWSIKGYEDVEGCLKFIEDHIHECVAIGEVGLDYKVKVNKKIQHHSFERVIDIAKRWEKPICIHSLYSYERTYRMVREMGISKAVFHWYSGPVRYLEGIISEGYLISATPALKYSESHRRAISYAPLENILVETDTPVVYQGMESRPYNIWNTIRELAELKGISIEEATYIATRNAIEFFGLKDIDL